MNIWAFLFYSYFLFELGGSAGKYDEKDENTKAFINLIFAVFMVSLFIYMGWYQ